MYVNKIGFHETGTTNILSNPKNSVDFSSLLNNKMTETGTNLDDIFSVASQTYDVPEYLLKAVAKAESNFRADARSSCGAMGVMQLMPGTAKSLGVTDPYDPAQNIMGGANYLRKLLDQFDGNIPYAVAAYNAGSGNVKKYNGIPPFAETQNYVNKVMGYCNDTPSIDTAQNTIASLSQTSSDNTMNNIDTTILAAELFRNIYQLQMQLMEQNNNYTAV